MSKRHPRLLFPLQVDNQGTLGTFLRYDGGPVFLASLQDRVQVVERQAAHRLSGNRDRSDIWPRIWEESGGLEIDVGDQNESLLSLGRTRLVAGRVSGCCGLPARLLSIFLDLQARLGHQILADESSQGWIGGLQGETDFIGCPGRLFPRTLGTPGSRDAPLIGSVLVTSQKLEGLRIDFQGWCRRVSWVRRRRCGEAHPSSCRSALQRGRF